MDLGRSVGLIDSQGASFNGDADANGD